MPRPARLDDRERGSVSVYFATASFAMVLLSGLAIDLTGQVHAQQETRSVAAQAARIGGQQIEASRGVRGASARAVPTQAIRAAQTYLASAGVSGNASVVDGTTLVVNASDTYDTKVLSVIGLRSLTVTGHAEARIARSVDGVEQ